jgi:hypothetical protein
LLSASSASVASKKCCARVFETADATRGPRAEPGGLGGAAGSGDSFLGSMSLLTGTLPAQYGLRTASVLDITSRTFATPGGEVSLYGGSRQTLTPSFDYGGSIGNSEYFVTARGTWNNLGLENPTSSLNVLHDQTQQGKFFGYRE